MTPKKIRAELPESKSEYVPVRGYYVPPHYRRRPRPRRSVITEILQKCERERIRAAIVETAALSKRLHYLKRTCACLQRFRSFSPSRPRQHPVVG